MKKRLSTTVLWGFAGIGLSFSIELVLYLLKISSNALLVSVVGVGIPILGIVTGWKKGGLKE